jgi:hypothetical protein
VRRTAAYWRYDTAHEMAVLNQIWTTLSPLTNLFTPQQKLTSKTRTGAKVTKKYDTAQTPYQRLLAHHPGVLDKKTHNYQPNGSKRPTPPRPAATSPTCRRPSLAWSRAKSHPARQTERRLPLPGNTGRVNDQPPAGILT